MYPAAPSIQGMKCLVTGAGGFIGSALCAMLCDKGARVRGFVRHIPPILSNYPISWSLGDHTDKLALAQAIRGQDIVFHLIGNSTPEFSNKNPAADLSANVLPAIALLEVCRAEGVSKILFALIGRYGVRNYSC